MNDNLPGRTAELTGQLLPKHSEDALHRPKFDEAPEPGKYRRMADDPVACRAMAAEVLDWAFNADADASDIRNVVPLANCWMRLSELAHKQRGGE